MISEDEQKRFDYEKAIEQLDWVRKTFPDKVTDVLLCLVIKKLSEDDLMLWAKIGREHDRIRKEQSKDRTSL